MASVRVRRLQLEAEIAAARLREESLQYAWGTAQYTSSSTRSAEAIGVDLLRVQAEVAELEERIAELDGAPAEVPPPEAAPAPGTANPATTGRFEPEPEYVDTKGAARLLGISPRTLEGLRARGEGPPFRKEGKRVLYPLAALRSPPK